MKLTNKQEQGLKIAVERYKNKEKYTVISGYAGSGKSTLVRFIIAALDVKEEDVCYATYTGKAAQVLLKKGNKNVYTLHKLLYKSIPKPNGGFLRIPKEVIPYKVVIVDEVSMAPKKLMQLLSTHNVHIICLGDPFQLPPVDKNEDNHLLDCPHIFLDEIMRQAQESEIIRLSMQIRHMEEIPFSNGKEVMVLPKQELNTGMLTWANQIIVGTNATRVSINNQMRQLLGRGETPEDGDKVICLKNYWDDLADNDDPLINGTIGYIYKPTIDKIKLPYFAGGQTIESLNAYFTSDSNADFGTLHMDNKMILTGKKCVDWKTEYKINKNEKTRGLIPKEFTYGYAITCWKAQGSEWNKVLIIEENFPYDKITHRKALYTAVTRATEKMVLLKN